MTAEHDHSAGGVDETSSTLNQLIQTCKDGEKGFHTAAEAVNDPNLRHLFERPCLSSQPLQLRATFCRHLARAENLERGQVRAMPAPGNRRVECVQAYRLQEQVFDRGVIHLVVVR